MPLLNNGLVAENLLSAKAKLDMSSSCSRRVQPLQLRLCRRDNNLSKLWSTELVTTLENGLSLKMSLVRPMLLHSLTVSWSEWIVTQ